ncbi:MAG: glucosaminidase domain-containing protein [Lewinellaceae bacterium]|nr:glucosaminidase domain-containing protein [Lewinellaceae bacterium]
MKENKLHRTVNNGRHTAMNRNGGGRSVVPVMSLRELLARFIQGIHNVYIALKFQVFVLIYGQHGERKLPYFRLAFLAFVIFVVFRKDIQFSINMQVPQGGDGHEQVVKASSNMDELSIVASPVSLRNAAPYYQPATFRELEEGQARAFINRFSRVAQAEMDKFHIPASVKMAQGLMESRAGTHPAVAEHQNYFGQSMHGRDYASAWENWRAHSLMLSKQLSSLCQKEVSYRDWATALAKQQGSAQRNYAKNLVEIIERYQLYLLDEK